MPRVFRSRITMAPFCLQETQRQVLQRSLFLGQTNQYNILLQARKSPPGGRCTSITFLSSPPSPTIQKKRRALSSHVEDFWKHIRSRSSHPPGLSAFACDALLRGGFECALEINPSTLSLKLILSPAALLRAWRSFLHGCST
jgi:hypothetical protein